MTPLQIAAYFSDHAKVKRLLAENPTVNERNRFGRTALHYASENVDSRVETAWSPKAMACCNDTR